MYGDHCLHCFRADIYMQALTAKMQKYGFEKDIPIFKVSNHSEMPWLPSIPGTPTFFYLRKDPKTGHIVELETISEHFWINDIVSRLAEKTKLSGFKDKLYMDKTWQSIQYF